MPVDLAALPSVVQMAVPFFLISMIGEIVFGRMTGKARYEAKDTAASLGMGVGNLAIGIAMGLVAFSVYGLAFEYRLFDIPATWAWIAVCFVVDDFFYYWTHRFYHEIRWMWASHVVHHSSQHYNLSTALRQTWTGSVSLSVFVTLPMAFIGFDPLMVGFVAGINLVYQYWIHTEAIDKCPRWFEAVMNTPSHHRVHHSTQPQYLDSNYAGVFIIWDKMFGSFIPERDDLPMDYGIVHNLGTFNPFRIAFHEYVGIFKDVLQPGISLGQRFAYIFARPGYSHDGSRKTSQDLKADYLTRHPDEAGQPGLPASLLSSADSAAGHPAE